MTILFDSRRTVKPTATTFAKGILRRPPLTQAVEPTLDDRAWWAAECDRRENGLYNAYLDAMARETAEIDRVSRGPVL